MANALMRWGNEQAIKRIRRKGGKSFGRDVLVVNIVGNPDKVSIDVDRHNIPVIPEQLQGAERDRAWKMITEKAPRFAQYEKKTDRVIPVIRLTAR